VLDLGTLENHLTNLKIGAVWGTSRGGTASKPVNGDKRRRGLVGTLGLTLYRG
jgi:hypothetical protein